MMEHGMAIDDDDSECTTVIHYQRLTIQLSS